MTDALRTGAAKPQAFSPSGVRAAAPPAGLDRRFVLQAWMSRISASFARAFGGWRGPAADDAEQAMNGRRTTLALGGGGARGVAHLGAIEVLLEFGFDLRQIVGVSIGSLAGAMYAFDPDIRAIQNRALDYLLSPAFQRHQRQLFGAAPRPGEETTGGVFTWYNRINTYLRRTGLLTRAVRKPSLLPGSLMQDVVDHLLPDVDIADAKIPLAVVAVDLHSGKRVTLEKGPVRLAVRGSSAVPGIFPPVEYDGMLLCDVGVFCSVPTNVARTYAHDCVVAVDVSSGMKPLSKCETALDVMMRMDEIGESLFREYLHEAADYVIRPEVAHIEWFDFSSCVDLVEAGRAAARSIVTELRAA